MGDSGPYRPGRRFALQVVLPISALLGATIAVLSVLLAWTALEQNHYAADSSRRLAEGAIEVAREAMVRTIVDYAVWDEAVRHLAFTVDEVWAEENLAGLGKTVGADLTFALDPAGRTTFGLVDEVRAAGPVGAYLAGGVEELLRAARARPGEGVAAFLQADGTPVMAVAAAVLPHTAEVAAPSGPPTILLAADRLDAARLRELGEVYLLRDLTLARAASVDGPPPPPPPRGGELLPLEAADGTLLGGLAWRPDRPGTELLRRLAPALAALALGLALAAVLVLRHARHAALVIRATEERATTDALTGLPNRALLRDRIRQGLARLRRDGGELALLYLDLDGFKPVNDTHGHAAGDALLRLVADRLRDCVRANDTIARMGGDEFVILLAEPASADAATACARRAAAALGRPFQLADATTVVIGVSVGAAVASAATPDADALLRAADRALYRAKQEGRGTWRLADEAWVAPATTTITPATA